MHTANIMLIETFSWSPVTEQVYMIINKRKPSPLKAKFYIHLVLKQVMVHTP